jgi:hypothetical protein
MAVQLKYIANIFIMDIVLDYGFRKRISVPYAIFKISELLSITVVTVGGIILYAKSNFILPNL